MMASSNPLGARKAPELCYIICATPRSGSALLCEALGRTRLAGVPREYLREWSTDNPAELKQAGRFPPDAYLRRLFEECSTPNGVFGVKIMGSYFGVVIDTLRPFSERPDGSGADILASAFPNLQYIYLSRRDTVRQAVSWAKASQSGEWHEVVSEHARPRPGRKHQPVYDFNLIARHHREVLEQEHAWQAYFTSAGLRPYRIAYEDFEQSYERAGPDVLDYLQIPHPDGVVTRQPALRRQSDAVNENWTERFTEELAQLPSRGMFRRTASYFTRLRSPSP